jgi:AraC family transcriptional regulator, regulatory protein of adaptative response / DNA-3-methyladenine glycosylase II
VVSRALRLIGEGALDTDGVARLADRLGVTDRHLRRLFLQHLGATPLDVALTRRVHFAKKLLDETVLSCQQVALAAGFGSLRRFNGEIRRTYSRTPTELRRLARKRQSTDPECYRFRLAYRPPYDWQGVLAFLAARATPGVEHVDQAGYRRTIDLDGMHGTIGVSHADAGSALDLEVCFPNPRALLAIVERVKRIFDLGADPSVISGQLANDASLRAAIRAHPGIRTPGAWDGFELAVRAIIGQQISVRGATTIAGRIAAVFGSPLPVEGRGFSPVLTHLFPTAAQLVDAPIERAGVIAARANAIRALARRVVDGHLLFDPMYDSAATVGALKQVPGIGEWTAQYIAMRALGEPDAFPSGDVVLQRMCGGLTSRELGRRAESWRPWRSYAVMLLWQSAADQRKAPLHGAPGEKHANSARRRHPRTPEHVAIRRAG